MPDTTTQLDPELLSALEDQRDFLLRSLDDLEREHDAGDVDDTDYEALKDDYTARAAAVIRAIDRRRARFMRPSSTRRRGPAIAWIAGVLAFALLAGVLVARAAGRRDTGEVATGDVRTSVTEDLNRAGNRAAEGDLDAAVDIYDEVLARSPDNAEAATYRGWVLYLDGEREAGLTQLLEAATASPDYPDAHAFLAVVFFRSGLLDEAQRELDLLEELDAPAGLRQLVEPLAAEIAAARASTTTTSSS